VAEATPSGAQRSGALAEPGDRRTRPLLSVVVPVFGGGGTIVENVAVIRGAVRKGVGDSFEVIVVSDGSLDETVDRLLESEQGRLIRLIHYDRNLGKGYAVKAGGLAARGEWVAFVDADLDIDPSAIGTYLEVARRESLDFAIGSKRHPDSEVVYPRSRRVASWCYQTLNHLLFGLDVRDTQVGLKVFSGGVAREVLPLLLVKQYAFDLELLAVARALGYERVRELPVRLEYRFTGSGVGSAAVLRALLDTAAIFYRLRILRTYQRKRRMLQVGDSAWLWTDPPLVSLIGGDADVARSLEYPSLEVLGSDPVVCATDGRGDLLAIVPPGSRPAGNWLSSAVPFFARPEVCAVVSPEMAPGDGPMRERAAAAVLESRVGGGSRRMRFSPGNLRTVVDFPAGNIVIRRSDYLDALRSGVDEEGIVAWLAARGRETVYIPDTIVVTAPEPLFRPHLRATVKYARARGRAARGTHGRSLSAATFLSLLPALCGMIGIPLLLAGEPARTVGVVLVTLFAATVLAGSALGAVRFHSLRVGLLTVPALVATQATYIWGFVAGFLRGQ
jgi:glycosyltransferase involved in cell wall biosynthesis